MSLFMTVAIIAFAFLAVKLEKFFCTLFKKRKKGLFSRVCGPSEIILYTMVDTWFRPRFSRATEVGCPLPSASWVLTVGLQGVMIGVLPSASWVLTAISVSASCEVHVHYPVH